MKKLLYIIIPVLFFGCIDEYNPRGIEEISNLLVVEGTVTDGESVFKLSRSVGLMEDLSKSDNSINDALVYVEKENGERIQGYLSAEGTYTVATEKLDAKAKYRFYAVVDNDEYSSGFLSPLYTPEIDDIALIKRRDGVPVDVCVTTHDPYDQSRYYLWSYEEHWEVKAELFANFGLLDGDLDYFSLSSPRNTYYCWAKDSSKTMILGTAEKLVENTIYQKKIKEIPCSDERLSILYYINVKQMQIRKEAYDYFFNIQKNVEQTGSIFSPVPSEIKGNIICSTNPDLPVIGYIDVSSITERDLFNDGSELYEAPVAVCHSSITDDVSLAYPTYGYYEVVMNVPIDLALRLPILYAPHDCVDCRRKDRATKNKPVFWPNNHL